MGVTGIQVGSAPRNHGCRSSCARTVFNGFLFEPASPDREKVMRCVMMGLGKLLLLTTLLSLSWLLFRIGSSSSVFHSPSPYVVRSSPSPTEAPTGASRSPTKAPTGASRSPTKAPTGAPSRSPHEEEEEHSRSPHEEEEEQYLSPPPLCWGDHPWAPWEEDSHKYEVSPGCPVQHCQSDGCSKCASRPGRRVSAFVQKMISAKEGDKPIVIAPLGNSVASSNHFGTTNTFADMLRLRFPRATVNVDTSFVFGATEPENVFELVRARPESFTGVDMFIVQYQGLMHKPNGEELVRALLNLPQKATVAIVQHCIHEQWTPECLGGGCPSGREPAHFVDEMRRTLQLIAHYNLPAVSACTAMSWWQKQPLSNNASSVLPPSMTMTTEKRGRVLLSQLHDEFFVDAYHYNKEGTTLEGCLLADVISNPVSLDQVDHELPPSMWPPGRYYTTWVRSARDGTLVPSPDSHGWAVQTGGRNHAKKWIEADKAGAELRFTLPPPCKADGAGDGADSEKPWCVSALQAGPAGHWQLALEYYRHNDLPMGMLQIDTFETLLEVDSVVAAATQTYQRKAVEFLSKAWNGLVGIPKAGSDGFAACSDETFTCLCNGLVRFGVEGRWSPVLNVNGEIGCDQPKFGADPAPNMRKSCQCQSTENVQNSTQVKAVQPTHRTPVSSILIDGCCDGLCGSTGVAKQGFYTSTIIADHLSLQSSYYVVLHLLHRNETSCSEIGDKFSITGLSSRVSCHPHCQ